MRVRLFRHLHDDIIQGNAIDGTVFENPCGQIGRVHFVHFVEREVKG